MRTAIIEVYKFDELSEKAKQKAYYDWLDWSDYPWADENEETLKVFEKIFPVKIKYWEYGYQSNIHFQFMGDNILEDLSGIRLLKYIYNNYYDVLFKGKYYSKSKYVNGKFIVKDRYSKIIKDNCCVLTGYWIDDEILKPIYDFLKNPKKDITFNDLMGECLNSWLRACAEDYECHTSKEFFAEECNANDYEFTEDGKLFRR